MTRPSHVVPRSPDWPAFAKAQLAAHPECAACGPLWKPATLVQVHHIFPVHFLRALGTSDLELDSRNAIVLCSSVLRRLPTLEEMSFAQKHALRALMDKAMPLGSSK